MNIKISSSERDAIVYRSAAQISRGVFFSTIIIIASFLPVFLLTGQEGKLFHPLAWTKTFMLIVDALLVITLAPVIISLVMRGRFRSEQTNPLTRTLMNAYTPVIQKCLTWRKTTIAINVCALVISIPLLFSLGTEFMPPLDEQSILFMPVTLPDVSNAEIKRILQVQDKIIASVPEVDQVLGKAGRAITPTDNAPINMIETLIMLKPKAAWRPGRTKSDIIRELDDKLQIPGVINGWTQPIINRINMLSTGIRTDVGIKVYGQNLDTIDHVAQKIREAIRTTPGVEDLYVEPITGGHYLMIKPDLARLGRYGLTVQDIDEVVESGIGGVAVGTTIEGRRRFSISLRYGQDFRNSVERIRRTGIRTRAGSGVPLSSVASVDYENGPPMISSDNGQLRGAVLFNVRNRDLGSTVNETIQRVNQTLTGLPAGYYFEWSGQYQNLMHGKQTLMWVVPVVLLVIFVCLYLAVSSLREAFLSLLTIPFALTGGVIIVWLYPVSLSVAVAVGFIALFGIAVETGVVMMIYLNDAMQDLVRQNGNSASTISKEDLRNAVIAGATRRLRPKLMTVCVALFGLIPVLWSHGAGSDVMLPIVLPVIGGVLTSSTHILLVTPLIFLMTREYELKKFGKLQLPDTKIF